MAEVTGISVLHVDDDPAFADLTADMLAEQAGEFTVETATSASEGLDLLSTTDFDCIVSDYAMPGQNGIEFLKTLSEENPDLPFILYTGQGSEEVASDAIAAGATDYLQKEGGTDHYELLANRIQNAVEQSRAQQRAAELERIRALVNDINQALLRANSRSAVETQVCEIISESDPYLFAWIGEVDAETDRVEPRAWAGVEDGYFDDITVTADETATGRGPTGTAIREQQLAVSQSLQENGEYIPGRESARDRGYQSNAAVPLAYNDTLYGVLNVYAGRQDAFDEDEQEVLTELAGDIGAAIHRMEIKDSLERAQQRAEQYFETAGNVMVVLNIDGTVARINERGCNLLGYEHSELVGSDWFDFVVPETIEREITDIFSAFRSEDAKPIQTNVNPIETKDGEQIVVKWHNTAIRDQEGNVTGVLSSGIDITDRKQKEQKLERFKKAVEHAGHAIYVTDSDGTIEYANPAFEAITGYSAEEALGRNPQILQSGEMSEGYYEKLWETLLDGSVWEEEVINRRQDGELYTAHQTIAPILDETDDIDAFVAIQSDITERKERERALEESERRYRSLFESNPEVVWVEDFSAVRDHIEALRAKVDDVQAYLESNPEEIDTLLEQVEVLDVSEQAVDRYGAPSKEALLENMGELFTPEAYEANAEIWRRLADGETHFRVQTVAETFDGDRYDEIIDVRVLDSYTDDYSRVYLTAIDITERKEREEELQRQNSRLNEFASVVSHDLRNPLTVAIGRAKLLQDRCDDESQEHVDTIVTALERMESIIEDTLTLARQGNTVGEMAPIPITSLVEQCWDSVETTGATLDNADEFTIRGDRERLRHVFENLFRNAVEHAGDDVTVRVGRAGEDRFYVKDDGTGIPADDRETVFEAGHSSATEGTGFGLTIVKRIAEAHGWEVSITDSRNGGARFEFDSVEMISE